MAEPVGIIAGAYAVETAVEGAIAAYFVTTPTLPLKAELKHVASAVPLRRQKHALAVIGTQAFIFGGEETRDDDTSDGTTLASNEVKILSLSETEDSTATNESVPPKPVDEESTPPARKGCTGVAARNRMFVFGGEDKSGRVLEEQGKLWVFDPTPRAWLTLSPPPATEYPAARTNHSSVASDDGNILFFHGGQDADGNALSDTWAFHLDHGKWTKLAETPWPATVGTSIAYAVSKLWLFGSFPSPSEGADVETRLASLEIPKLEPFKEGTLSPTTDAEKAYWTAHPNPPAPSTASSITNDTKEAFSEELATTTTTEDSSKPSPALIPSPRLHSSLQTISTGQGRHYLLVTMGHAPPPSPASAPSQGESPIKYHQEMWAFQLPSPGTTGAGVKDWIRQRLPGTKDFQGQWAPVEVVGLDVGEDEKVGGKWTGRGWVAGGKTGDKQVLLWGGRDERGEVLGDGWIVKIQ